MLDNFHPTKCSVGPTPHLFLFIGTDLPTLKLPALFSTVSSIVIRTISAARECDRSGKRLPISKGLARVLSAGQFILPFVIEKSCWGLRSTELCTLSNHMMQGGKNMNLLVSSTDILY